MVTISAPASVWDYFDRVEHWERYKKSAVIEFKTLYFEDGNLPDKDTLIELLQNCTHYTIENNDLLVTVNKTAEEIIKDSQEKDTESDKHIAYNKANIKRWAEQSDENKEKCNLLSLRYGIDID